MQTKHKIYSLYSLLKITDRQKPSIKVTEIINRKQQIENEKTPQRILSPRGNENSYET
jgi:hypothetical protein